MEIHAEIFGCGHPLLLIHGWAMHGGIWHGFAKKLATGYKVVCVDLPGYGYSPELDRFSPETVGEALLKAMPDAKFAVLGWSLGATLAIEMANCYPERITSLILLAGTPKFVASDGWPGVGAGILQSFRDRLSVDLDGTLQRFLALQVHNAHGAKQQLRVLKNALYARYLPQLSVLQAGLGILQNVDLRVELACVRCPTSVILGEADVLVPPAGRTAMLRLNPRIRAHILERAGHAPFLSHGAKLAEIVMADL